MEVNKYQMHIKEQNTNNNNFNNIQRNHDKTKSGMNMISKFENIKYIEPVDRSSDIL